MWLPNGRFHHLWLVHSPCRVTITSTGLAAYSALFFIISLNSALTKDCILYRNKLLTGDVSGNRNECHNPPLRGGGNGWLDLSVCKMQIRVSNVHWKYCLLKFFSNWQTFIKWIEKYLICRFGFLVANWRLYKRLCLPVRQLVRQSVCPLVCWTRPSWKL